MGSDDMGTARDKCGNRRSDEDPVAHGWPDQTWTLARTKTLIGRRFHRSYTIQGVAALLKRHGWTRQERLNCAPVISAL